MANTYRQLLQTTKLVLQEAGSEMAQLEARELVCHAAGMNRERLYRDMSLEVPKEAEQCLEELIRQYRDGTPIAYLLGEWEFYGLSLTVSSKVLIPRADTEVLAERGIQRASTMTGTPRILDLCAGSGCIGLAIAANVPSSQVILGELSEDALGVCRENVRRTGLEGQAEPRKMDVWKGPEDGLGLFDVLVSNPPYIPTEDIYGLDRSVKDYEPWMALDGGTDGLDFYRAIAARWKDALRPGGAMLFEVGIGQAPDVEEILRLEGYVDVKTTMDTQSIGRVVEGTRNN